MKPFVPLSESHSGLAAEAHGWDPTTVSAGSSKPHEWQCSLGHVWTARVDNRVFSTTGCPYCSGSRVLVGFNDLATTHPGLAAEAHGWDPTTVSAGSSKKLEWQCSLGHVWTTSINVRTLQGSGCPYCSGSRVLVGFNDLATTHPGLAAEAHGWDPTSVSAGTTKQREWRCLKDHVWTAQVVNRTGGTGCPYCSGQRVLVGFNDLATTHPGLAAEAHGWDPTTVSAGSSKKLEWQCSLGHVWTTSINVRTLQGSGCPYCSGSRVLVGFNDLATTHPGLAAEAHGWDPTSVSAGTTKQREWRCLKDHVWTAQVVNRTGGTGCPYCSGQRVLVGFNDLATTHPGLAAEAHGWDPTSVSAGSDKKRQWECPFGHTWTASISNRTIIGTGCPSCARSGFDPNSPGWVYLVRHEFLELLQIGISNKIEDRLKSHGRRNWECLDVVGPLDGQTARDIEVGILAYLDSRSIRRGKAVAQSFDGYTEAWRWADLEVLSIRELQSLVRDWKLTNLGDKPH